MRFGIDYDGTWTAAPGLFRWFVEMVKSHGHEAVIVTRRSDPGDHPDFMAQPVRDDIGDLCPIVFCGHNRKDRVAEAAGYPVDIWIDDHPHLITNDDPEDQ